MVKAVQPEETRQAAALVNSGIRDRRVLVNWWQMSVSLDANEGFRRERGWFVSNCGSKELKMLFMTGIQELFCLYLYLFEWFLMP